MGEATTLLQEFDFRRAAVPDRMLILSVEQAAIDQGLSDAAQRFLTIEPSHDGIRPGDIVGISYPNGSPDGSPREAHFSVGRGFFDPQLERALLGMTCGQTAVLTVKGQSRQVTILSVKRRNIPSLTDCAIASIGLPGVETIAAYRQYLTDRAVARKRAERDPILVNFVQKQVLAQSVFTPVDRTAEEYRELYKRTRSQAREMAGQGGDSSETEVLRRMLGLKKGINEETVLTALAEHCDREMQLLAIGRAHAAQHGVVYTPEDCQRELRQFADDRGLPYEDMLERYTLQSLLNGKYMQFYRSEILAHYGAQYTVTID